MAATRKGQAQLNGAGGNGAMGSRRRADMVAIAADLFAQKGYRATTVREIADAAGILSGSLYHHFDSKESIGDEILSGFIGEVLADYRSALADAACPRAARCWRTTAPPSRMPPARGPRWSRSCAAPAAPSPSTGQR